MAFQKAIELMVLSNCDNSVNYHGVQKPVGSQVIDRGLSDSIERF